MSDDNEGKRQLVEVIKALRSDIQLAMHEGTGQPIRFDVNEIEVELKTAITKKGGLEGGGKVEFKILGFGAEANAKVSGELAKEDMHTIKLKLKPVIDKGDEGTETISLSD